MSVVGDFNAWSLESAPMKRDRDGVWSAFVPGMELGAIYKYAVTDAKGNTCLLYTSRCV